MAVGLSRPPISRGVWISTTEIRKGILLEGFVPLGGRAAATNPERPGSPIRAIALTLSHAADPCVWVDMNQTDQHVDLIQRLFEAIERRDQERFAACLHPNCEFSWPPSLPYGGTVAASAPGPGWLETWATLQPTEVERAMSPQVVATARNVLVVRWHQRGRNAAGDTIDTPVLSSYTIEDGRLRQAEMFYFDLPAVHLFLDLSTRRHR